MPPRKHPRNWSTLVGDKVVKPAPHCSRNHSSTKFRTRDSESDIYTKYSRLSESSAPAPSPPNPNRLALQQSHSPRYPTQHPNQQSRPLPAPSRASRASPPAIPFVDHNGLASKRRTGMERKEDRTFIHREHRKRQLACTAWRAVFA